MCGVLAPKREKKKGGDPSPSSKPHREKARGFHEGKPRRRQGAEVEEKKIRVLNPDEITRLLDTIEEPKYKMLVQLAIMSGARQGELLGLK